MNKENNKKLSLKEHLNNLLIAGRHWFIVKELKEHTSLKESSLRVALSRMAKAGQINMIRRGFGIILPNHRQELNPTHYVDAMMRHQKASYYVGLLSAAAHWGASHQASMAYQIVADKIVAPLKFKRGRIEFITKKAPLPTDWIRREAGIGGYIQISSPELTVIDLIRFPQKSGHLNNVATVLSELSEKWDGRTMTSLCRNSYTPTATLQRLGYILDEVLGMKKEVNYVAKALKERKPNRQMLSLAKKSNRKETPFNKKWSLYINTTVEPD